MYKWDRDMMRWNGGHKDLRVEQHDQKVDLLAFSITLLSKGNLQ